jgi:serine/threonine protein phosphatase PrpC
MDELEIHSAPGEGVHVLSRRWLRTAHSAERLDFGVATRSCREMTENGDAFVFKRWNQFALMGVIDGLGHGPLAQHASHTARQYVEEHCDQPLRNLFRDAGRACHGTRGVVMALARLDFSRRLLTVASVGNIETRLVGGSKKLDLMVRRGIVGLNAPEAVPAELPWSLESTLIMHSDGLSDRWSWNEYQRLADAAPEVLAHRMLEDLGKIDDDATVIVVRSAR